MAADVTIGNYPTYTSGYNPSTGSVEDYMKQYQANQGGGSPWLKMGLEKSALDQASAREKAGRDSNASTHQQLDQLAAQGGLSSGATERAAEGGAKNYLGMSQDIARSGQVNDLGLQMQDQQMGQQKLTTALQAKQADVANEATEAQRQSQYQMDLYKTQMETQAANRQAQATENSGKK